MKIINCSKDKKLIILMVFSYFFSPFLRAQGMAYSINVVEECIKAANESNESISNKVLKFAKDKLGRVVPGGTCWDLPYQALKQKGGKIIPDIPKRKDLYIWSTEIVTEKNNLNTQLIHPGDIIQFLGNGTGYSFTNKIEEIFRITSNCKSVSGEYNEFFGFPLHSAIISKVIDVKTGTLEIIHQWKGKPVHVGYISLIDHYIYMSDEKLNLAHESIYIDKKKQITELKIDNYQTIDKRRIQNNCGVVLLISNTGSGNFIIYRPQEK